MTNRALLPVLCLATLWMASTVLADITIHIQLRPRYNATPVIVPDPECPVNPDKIIQIFLSPPNATTPLSNFHPCGLDETVDSERLLAEWNGPYVFAFLNLKDSNVSYSTSVYRVMTFTSTDTVLSTTTSNSIASSTSTTPTTTTTTLNSTTVRSNTSTTANPSIVTETNIAGLYSLFISPPTYECNNAALEAATRGDEGFYSVFVGVSKNFLAQKKIFAAELNCLKTYYGDQKPNLCATELVMKEARGKSMVKTMQNMFNFAYNEGRKVSPNRIRQCNSSESTKDTIQQCSFFDTTSDMWFARENQTCDESNGFVKAELLRVPNNRKAVCHVKTSVLESENAATDNDFVHYDGPIVFEKDAKSAEVYVGLKIDDIIEEDETFAITLETLTPIRRKREPLSSLHEKMALITIRDRTDEEETLCKKLIEKLGEMMNGDGWLSGSSKKRIMTGQTTPSEQPTTLEELIKSYSEERIATNVKGVFAIALYKERIGDGKGIISTESADRNTETITLPTSEAQKHKYDPHAEVLIFDSEKIKDKDTQQYKQIQHFYLDVSKSPCLGCKNAISEFIDIQIKFATNENPFLFHFTFASMYNGKSRSDTPGQAYNVVDPRTMVEHALQTAKFIARNRKRADASEGKFIFEYDDSLRQKRPLKLENLEAAEINQMIMDIFCNKPDEEKQREVESQIRLLVLVPRRAADENLKDFEKKRDVVHLRKQLQARTDQIWDLNKKKEGKSKEERKKIDIKVEVLKDERANCNLEIEKKKKKLKEARQETLKSTFMQGDVYKSLTLITKERGSSAPPRGRSSPPRGRSAPSAPKRGRSSPP